VLAIARQGLIVRGLFETAWIWAFPLPKLALTPGSLYTLGVTAMPFWTFGSLALLLLGPRLAATRAPAREAAMTRVRRRFALHLVWLAALTVTVGFTSCETRHLHVSLPLVCVLVANALHRRFDLEGLRVAQTRALIAMAVMLLACVVFTVAVYGQVRI